MVGGAASEGGADSLVEAVTGSNPQATFDEAHEVLVLYGGGGAEGCGYRVWEGLTWRNVMKDSRRLFSA